MKAFSFTTILVLGGGACAAALSAAAMMAAAFATDESTSVGRGASCLLFPGGPGACAYAVLPTDIGYGSELYTADNLSMANLTGGAAAAAGSCGSPGSPHGDLYMCCGLQWGSGGEKQIGILPFWGALGRALAQPFSFLGSLIRYGSALPCLRRRWRRRWQDSFSCSPPTIAAFTFIAVDFC